MSFFRFFLLFITLVSSPAVFSQELILLSYSHTNFFDQLDGYNRNVETNGDLKLAEKDDVLVFPVPGGEVHSILIKDKVTHRNGDATLHGLIQDKYEVTITRGERGSFGKIATPEGSYSILIESGGEYLLTPSEQKNLIPVPFGNDAQSLPLDAHNDFSASYGGVADKDDTSMAEIDVMILFTPELTTRLGSVGAAETRMNQLIALANKAYTDSQMFITLNLVHSEQIAASNASNSALDDITDGSGVFSTVSALRTSKGADLVVLLRNYDRSSHGGNCGRAWVLGNKTTGTMPNSDRDYGYGVVQDGSSNGNFCSDLTFAHEVGHNMGFAHDHGNASVLGLFSYSFGHDVPQTFATIMSYDNPEIGKFSNPNVLCAGLPCGIAEGAANSADNAKSGNNVRHAMAGFYQKTILPDVSIVATDDSAMEGNGATGYGLFTVSRTGDNSQALTVYLSISGTADLGASKDYQIDPALNPTATNSYSTTIPAGNSSVGLTIKPIDDSIQEARETIIFTLQIGNDYTISKVSKDAQVNVEDNVQPGDANGDGQLNVDDVVSLIRIVFSNDLVTTGADCNSDAKINVDDVVCIIRKVF